MMRDDAHGSAGYAVKRRIQATHRPGDIHDLATNGEAEISLDDAGIDTLCEKLSLAGVTSVGAYPPDDARRRCRPE